MTKQKTWNKTFKFIHIVSNKHIIGILISDKLVKGRFSV